MDEKILRIMAVACSFSGLALLFYISTQIEPQVSSITGLAVDDAGQKVRVCGTIAAKKVSKNHVFFDLQDSTGSIRLVIFNTTALKMEERGNSPYNLSKGEGICADGVVDEYPKGSGHVELIYQGGLFERRREE